MFNFLKKEKLVITNCVFNCGKEKCPKWIILKQQVKKENGTAQELEIGRCADTWQIYIMMEFKQSLEKFMAGKIFWRP